MAVIVLTGEFANVIIDPPVDDQETYRARCAKHADGSGRCAWTERYDTLDDASEYAADHADTGRI